MLTPGFRLIRISPLPEHRLGPAFHQKRSKSSCQSAWGGNARRLLYYGHVAIVLCRCPHLASLTGLGAEWILFTPRVTSPASRLPRRMNGSLAHALLKPFMSETSLRILTFKTSIPKGGTSPTLSHLQYLVRAIRFYATLLMTSPSLASRISSHPLRSLRHRLCLLRLFLSLSQPLMNWSRFTEPLVFTIVALVSPSCRYSLISGMSFNTVSYVSCLVSWHSALDQFSDYIKDTTFDLLVYSFIALVLYSPLLHTYIPN